VVEAEDVANLPLTLSAPSGGPGGRRDIQLRISDLDDDALRVTHVARFFAPLD
jgi:hypothetical protein